MRALPLTVIVTLIAVPATGWAQVGRVTLGEPLPELAAAEWANNTGTPALERLRDRIIVLFFFRTDDTSVDYFEELNKLHRGFQQRGVEIIGLTPQTRQQAENIVKGKEVSFVVGYGVDTENRYDVSGTPKVYLLDIHGRLVNRFHPGDALQDKITAQIRQTPPAGADPVTLKRRFGEAKDAFRNENYGRAYTLAKDVQKVAGGDGSIGSAVEELIKQIEEAARKWLDEARQAAQAKDFERAARILAALRVRFANEQIGADAATEIGRLMGDRDAKPILRAALENAEGELINDEAAGFESAGRYLEAVARYRDVTEKYENNDAARAAGKAIERINSDPTIQRQIRDLWAEQQASRWLDIADRFAKIEMYGKAREYYERILSEYPSAGVASQARQRLTALPKESPATPEKSRGK